MGTTRDGGEGREERWYFTINEWLTKLDRIQMQKAHSMQIVVDEYLDQFMGWMREIEGKGMCLCLCTHVCVHYEP